MARSLFASTSALILCSTIGIGDAFAFGPKLQSENCFLGQVSRISAYALCEGCDSAKNGALDASVAAHIAENGSNQVFLRFL